MLVCLAVALLSSTSFATACVDEKAQKPIDVKVMVLTLFGMDENTGQPVGEFKPWYEFYWKDSGQKVDVQEALHPVYYNQDGVCGTMLGEGKGNAAASLMAILVNPNFDFSHAYFIICGCGGVNPQVGTLGCVFIADYIVDYDLYFKWDPEDGPPPYFQLSPLIEADTHYRLNQDLAQCAMSLAKEIVLVDSPEAEALRREFPEEMARKKPFVAIGTHLCSDVFWYGKSDSQLAQRICQKVQAGSFSISDMENAALAAVLRRFGYLDRLIALRHGSDFTQPPPGQTLMEGLKALKEGRSSASNICHENGFCVGRGIIQHILSNWVQWRNGPPEANGQ